MRKHRPTLIAATVIGLLAGASFSVAAQDHDTIAAASLTGSIGGWREVSAGTASTTDGIKSTSGVVHAARWTTSDERLSGDVTYNGNTLDTHGISIQTATYEVTNDGGTWLGNATAYASESLGIDMDTVILTGQGAYEGLTAYVVLDFSKPREITGVIVPSAMPPIPESDPAE